MSEIDDILNDYGDRFAIFEGRQRLRQQGFTENRADNTQLLGDIWYDYQDRFAYQEALEAGSAFSAAALDWFGRVESNGGTIQQANKVAIDEEIFTGLPADGIPLSTFMFANLFMGVDNWTGAQVPIVGNPIYTGLDNTTFNRLTGITYATNRSTNSQIQASMVPQDSNHVSMYLTTTSGNQVRWGATSAGSRLTWNTTGTRGMTSIQDAFAATPLGRNLIATTRVGSGQYSYYADDTFVVRVRASVAPSAGGNILFNNFTTFGAGTVGWQSIGTGLTTTQVRALEARLEALQARLV